MKSVAVKKVTTAERYPGDTGWDSIDHRKHFKSVDGWACTICGNIYEDRGDAQHCYNTHGIGHAYPDMPSVLKRKAPLIRIGVVRVDKLDQSLVNEWT